MLETPRRDDTVRRAAVAYLANIRSFLADLAREAGTRDPVGFSRKWQMLMKGVIVITAEGDLEAGARAKQSRRS